MRRLLTALALTTGLSLIVTACRTVPEMQAYCPLDSSGVLVGRVEATDGVVGPFVVVARELETGKIAHRTFIRDTRAFAMLMDTGRYDFFAFSDVDGDGRRGADEPASAVYALRDELRGADLLELPPLLIEGPIALTARPRATRAD